MVRTPSGLEALVVAVKRNKMNAPIYIGSSGN